MVKPNPRRCNEKREKHTDESKSKNQSVNNSTKNKIKEKIGYLLNALENEFSKRQKVLRELKADRTYYYNTINENNFVHF